MLPVSALLLAMRPWYTVLYFAVRAGNGRCKGGDRLSRSRQQRMESTGLCKASNSSSSSCNRSFPVS